MKKESLGSLLGSAFIAAGRYSGVCGLCGGAMFDGVCKMCGYVGVARGSKYADAQPAGRAALGGSMRKRTVRVEFDLDRIGIYEDEYLAALHAVCQANPAPITDTEAAEMAEAVKNEIVIRWLRKAPVALYHHQGRHLRLSENEEGPALAEDELRGADPARTSEAAWRIAAELVDKAQVAEDRPNDDIGGKVIGPMFRKAAVDLLAELLVVGGCSCFRITVKNDFYFVWVEE